MGHLCSKPNNEIKGTSHSLNKAVSRLTVCKLQIAITLGSEELIPSLLRTVMVLNCISKGKVGF